MRFVSWETFSKSSELSQWSCLLDSTQSVLLKITLNSLLSTCIFFFFGRGVCHQQYLYKTCVSYSKVPKFLNISVTNDIVNDDNYDNDGNNETWCGFRANIVEHGYYFNLARISSLSTCIFATVSACGIFQYKTNPFRPFLCHALELFPLFVHHWSSTYIILSH